MVINRTAVARPSASLSVRNRRAFTLLELVVSLALLGLALAVVAPSLVLRPPSSEEALQRVVTAARRAAVNRSQSVTLSVDARGDWRVESAGRDAGELLISGELVQGPSDPIRIVISSVGLCMSEAVSDKVPAEDFDPLTCSMRDVRAEAR